MATVLYPHGSSRGLYEGIGKQERDAMGLLILVLLILLLVGVFPTAPWGGWHQYGYAPMSVLGVVLIIVVVLLLLGRL
jgi:Protein of unknown function (DUF3309)